jgi:O-antigen/teichoic acid export membrane protein
MSLKREVGLGLIWVAIATVGSRGLSFLRDMVLARLLVPGDFGLVGYALLIIGVLALFQELGFSSALIYRNGDVEQAADVTFITVIVSSIVLYGLAWSAAPLVADFFRNEALVRILRVLSLGLVISAISQVPLTLMSKQMGFKQRVIPELIAGLLGSGTSVVLALLGYGVWSIVYGQLIVSTTTTVLVWFFIPWRPRLRYDRRVARELWQYGRHIIGSQVLVFFITNIDDAFLGRMRGDADLGIYTLAYKFSNLPATHFSRMVSHVMFPAFSLVQNDIERLRRAFFRSVKFVSLVAFPITMVTIVFAEDFLVVAYGAKWFPAVVPLQFLAVYGLARAIAGNMGTVFKAGGKPKWLLYIAIWRLTMMAALLYPAIQWRGVTGVAILSAVVAMVDFVISLVLTNRIIEASWRRYAAILVPMLLASVGTALLAHRVYLLIVDAIHPFLSLPLSGGLAVALYLCILYALDDEIRDVSSQAVHGLTREVRRARLARQSVEI